MFTSLSWWGTIFPILAGIALGCAFSYALFYPLYEEFNEWYNTEKELLDTIIKISKTISKNGKKEM